MNEPIIPSPHQVTALILGAGEGLRLGLGPKAFLHQKGKTLLELAVAAVQPFAATTIAAVRSSDLTRARALNSTAVVIEGGPTRQQSLSALLSRTQTEYVIVHEVARPYAGPELFAAVLAAAASDGAAALFQPIEVRDSIALLDGNFLSAILPASKLVTLQTPHAYHREILLDADRKAQRDGWIGGSTAELMTRYGHSLKLVPGSPENIKITYQTDWQTSGAA